jgi:hypothetical protein
MSAEQWSEGLSKAGAITTAVGYATLPIGGEVLVGGGEVISYGGAAISVGNDISKKDYAGAGTTLALNVGFGALGAKVQDAKEITSVGKAVLGATIFTGGQIADKLASKFKTDHAPPKVEKDAPKFKDNHKQDKAVQDWFKKADEKENKKK